MTVRAIVTALSALLLAAPTTDAGEIVQSDGAGRLDVVAQSVPLYQVLEAVTRHVGASLTCPGRQPRQPVTIALRSVTPAEAVARILEGAGVGYVLRSDPSGTGVEALDLVESSSTPASAAPVRAAAAGRTKGTDAQPDDEPTPGVPAADPGPVDGDLGAHEAGMEASSWPSPPSIAPEPFPDSAIPAADGTFPPGMAPIGGVGSPGGHTPGADPSVVDSATAATGAGGPLPAPPVAAPAPPGPVGAPPPGMRLNGPPPTTPPPQPQ